jgi:hypothetical protein
MTDGMGRDEGQWGRRGCLTLTSSSHRVGRMGGVGDGRGGGWEGWGMGRVGDGRGGGWEGWGMGGVGDGRGGGWEGWGMGGVGDGREWGMGGVGWVGCNGVVSREKGVCGVVSFT